MEPAKIEIVSVESVNVSLAPGSRRAAIRRFGSLVFWVALVVVLGHFMIEAFVRQMLYPVPSFPVPKASSPLEEVRLSTAEADTVIGWFDPTGSSDGAATIQVLFLHGNGENLATLHMAGMFEEFRRLGVDVLAVDYPGYGRSTGTPGEAANVAAAVAGCEWLAERDPDAKRIVMGWSLGAAVAAQTATRCADQLHGIVLASAWKDLAGVAGDHFPAFVVRMAVSGDYDSAAALRNVDLPMILIHGDRDDLIATRHGSALRDSLVGAGRSVRWVSVAGAGHNDLMGRREVWRAVSDLIESVG
ncbi:MAG: alpha/beta hydrolase [Thermoanaerobaculia bacterium]|nr:alpha/beta hydrolase [Thermoanaerobaculia bacterium]